jgi:hypothetical protein
MVRKLFGVLCVALVLCLGAVLADEIMGSIVKVDTTKKTVTVKDKDGKETTYDVAAKAEYPPQRGKAKGEVGDPGTLETLKTSVEKAADAGRGYNAKLTRDEKTKMITKIEAVRGGKGKGGGGQ